MQTKYQALLMKSRPASFRDYPEVGNALIYIAPYIYEEALKYNCISYRETITRFLELVEDGYKDHVLYEDLVLYFININKGGKHYGRK